MTSCTEVRFVAALNLEKHYCILLLTDDYNLIAGQK